MAPKWYKDLFLEYMSEDHEDSDIVERIAMGRSREVLDKMSQVYMQLMVTANSTLGEMAEEEPK